MFGLAVRNNWYIYQIDVKTAFLYGDIDLEIYVELLLGFKKENKVCKLNKALYGLKQAPRIQYKTLTSALKELGFSCCPYDNAVFRKDSTYILVYINNLLITSPNLELIQEVKQSLEQRFKIKDIGECQYFLGIAVERKEGKIRLTQTAYLKAMIDKFGLSNANPVATPYITNKRQEPILSNYEATAEQRLEYQLIVGLLMYAILGTRPDLAFSVSIASRYCSNPLPDYQEQIKRIIRYVLGTLDTGLEFDRSLTAELIGFTDAKYAGDRKDSKSIRGYVFTIRGTAVSQRYKKQTTVALLTVEAEYTALYYAAKEAVQLKEILNFFDSPQDTIVIRVDNQAAIRISNNLEMYEKTKYIRVQFYFTRELVEDKTITILHVPRPFNTADIFTKALSQAVFKQYAGGIGIFGLYKGRLKKLKETGIDRDLIKAFIGYIEKGYSFPTVKAEVFQEGPRN